MLESGIGFMFNVILSTLSNFKYPVDFLDGIFFFKNKMDFFKEEVEIKDSYLILPENAWFHLDEEKLEKYIVRKIKLA